MQQNIVIGLGEIGSAVQKILKCDGYDKKDPGIQLQESYDAIHICFPYSEKFVEDVKFYLERSKAKLVVVHSTVPIGTCDPEGWVHSPVRGVHPNLEKGIRTFVKYFGGRGNFEASAIFAEKGIKCKLARSARDTEALKLWDTTQYGAMIAIEKEIHEYCKKNDLDFDIVYTDANKSYNEGYMELGRPEVVRPYLKHVPGPIGGHCVIPNADLLKSLTAYRVKEADQKARISD